MPRDEGRGPRDDCEARDVMARSVIQVTIGDEELAEVDRLVRDGIFPDRNRAFEESLAELLLGIRKRRLERELAKLDAVEEVFLAEEFLGGELEWPEY